MTNLWESFLKIINEDNYLLSSIDDIKQDNPNFNELEIIKEFYDTFNGIIDNSLTEDDYRSLSDIVIRVKTLIEIYEGKYPRWESEELFNFIKENYDYEHNTTFGLVVGIDKDGDTINVIKLTEEEKREWLEDDCQDEEEYQEEYADKDVWLIEYSNSEEIERYEELSFSLDELVYCLIDNFNLMKVED